MVEKIFSFPNDQRIKINNFFVKDIKSKLRTIKANFPKINLRLHLHNTRNTGIANAWAGIEEGVIGLDSSFGGCGGCPFAPNATGNIPTEDLLYMLDRSGVKTGLSLSKSIVNGPTSVCEGLHAARRKRRGNIRLMRNDLVGL